MPCRRAARNASGGDKRGDRLFDATAPDAVDQLAASLLAELTPPWSRWFGFRPGDQSDPAGRDDFARALDETAKPRPKHAPPQDDDDMDDLPGAKEEPDEGSGDDEAQTLPDKALVNGRPRSWDNWYDSKTEGPPRDYEGLDDVLSPAERHAKIREENDGASTPNWQGEGDSKTPKDDESPRPPHREANDLPEKDGQSDPESKGPDDDELGGLFRPEKPGREKVKEPKTQEPPGGRTALGQFLEGILHFREMSEKIGEAVEKLKERIDDLRRETERNKRTGSSSSNGRPSISPRGGRGPNVAPDFF